MTESIKILQIGLSSIKGGIENCILNYYRYIDKSKIHFDFVDIYGDGLAYSEEIKNLGGKIFVLKNFKKHPINFIYSLNKILKTNSYHIIHINMLSSANILPAIVACFHKKTKVFLHSHNSNIPKGSIRKILHYLNIFILRNLPAEHFACGEKAGKWLFGNNFSKENVIPNAIDIHLFKKNVVVRNEIREKCNFSPKDIVIGFVGRLCEQKNILFLPDILKELRKKRKNYKMLIIGDGELREKLIKKLNDFRLKEDVYLAGFQDKISNWYQAMDLFVLPSLFEGLPIVGIEAQISGLPCFLSDQISNEIKITNNVKFLPINNAKDIWVKSILNYDNCDFTNNQISNLWNIKISASNLENKYFKALNMKNLAQREI